MPTRVTLDTILPPLWCGLEIEPTEVQRPVSRARFESVLKSSETVVSPSVLKRMWETLARSEYAVYSPYSSETLLLDVPSIRIRLYARGMRTLVDGNTHNTHTTPTGGRVTQ